MNFVPRLVVIAGAAALVACGGMGDDPPPVVAEETRVHDSRIFNVLPWNARTAANAPVYPDFEEVAGAPSFTALSGNAADGTTPLSTTSRWAGELNGSAYRIEVPANWNGRLVMYAHGFRGTTLGVWVSNPAIRRHLVANGYAWAASSYSTNFYDVRAGVEDTNALALAFNSIAAARGRPLPAPTRIYITGHSMGGHVAAAAVEAETLATARNRVRYHGAVVMCGVTGDTALFDTFTAMQISAQALAGVPAYPLNRWADISSLVNGRLWTTPPAPGATVAATSPLGLQYLSVLENLTGGDRPLFDIALQRGGSFASAYGTFGGDGTITGILNSWGTDTNNITYTITGDPVASAALNASALRVTAAPDSNRQRTDGLRWIPRVNGQFSVPVVSIHTLGDLFVPFNMMQIHRQRAEANGSGGWLVQRAIRGISHCDFTQAERIEAFEAMVAWEQGGAAFKPAGDDVLTPSVVAAPTYGCTFTRAPVAGTDTASTIFLRGLIDSEVTAGRESACI